MAESEVLVLVQLWLLCLLQSTLFSVPERDICPCLGLDMGSNHSGSEVLHRRGLPECLPCCSRRRPRRQPPVLALLAPPPADLGTCARLHKQHSSRISPTCVSRPYLPIPSYSSLGRAWPAYPQSPVYPPPQQCLLGGLVPRTETVAKPGSKSVGSSGVPFLS